MQDRSFQDLDDLEALKMLLETTQIASPIANITIVHANVQIDSLFMEGIYDMFPPLIIVPP